jgi:hypothetical protein
VSVALAWRQPESVLSGYAYGKAIEWPWPPNYQLCHANGYGYGVAPALELPAMHMAMPMGWPPKAQSSSSYVCFWPEPSWGYQTSIFVPSVRVPVIPWWAPTRYAYGFAYGVAPTRCRSSNHYQLCVWLCQQGAPSLGVTRVTSYANDALWLCLCGGPSLMVTSCSYGSAYGGWPIQCVWLQPPQLSTMLAAMPMQWPQPQTFQLGLWLWGGLSQASLRVTSSAYSGAH